MGDNFGALIKHMNALNNTAAKYKYSLSHFGLAYRLYTSICSHTECMPIIGTQGEVGNLRNLPKILVPVDYKTVRKAQLTLCGTHMDT